MIDELLQIVLDPIYPPSEDYLLNRRTELQQFEKIYEESF